MIVESHFEQVQLLVSGQAYERCSFKNCELVFDGRPVHLVDCTIDGCHWSFVGPAGTTLQFLGLLCRNDPGMALFIGRQLGLVHEQSH